MTIKSAKYLTLGIFTLCGLSGCYGLDGCCRPEGEPSVPFGAPNKIVRHEDGSYASIEFIYYCRSGQYISATYIRPDNCSGYHKGPLIVGEGICDSLPVFFNEMSSDDQVEHLKSVGHAFTIEYSHERSSTWILRP